MSLPYGLLPTGGLKLGFTTSLHVQQWLGLPLRLVSPSWSDAWQAAVKARTALLLLGLNQWRAPVSARNTWDASLAGQIRQTAEGSVTFDFPRRLVMIANHQLYTDWLVLWWSAYTAGHHGHFYIVLKDALGKIPMIGSGIRFFGWILLSRRWESDKSSLERGLAHLSKASMPMWLLIFPEGTNLTKRSSAISRKWAEKNGLQCSDLTLLPRSRGLLACLQGLEVTVEWVYDCTIAYDGIPRGQDGQDLFNLKTLYGQGRAAPFTHAHWRRFAINKIPLRDAEAFDRWLLERWAEKAELLEHFRAHGGFPDTQGSITSGVELRSPFEMLQILTGVIAVIAAWLMLRFGWSGIVSLANHVSQQ
ncbi:hypothetical protein LTR95_013076 [Oleoguttula sp. CCFEE 5521]